MSAVTFSKSYVSEPRATQANAAPQKGFFARLMDAIIAARTAQAERELARYVHLHGRDPIA